MPKSKTNTGWRAIAKRSLAEDHATRVLKMVGAIEGMSDLLEHAQMHGYKVEENDIVGFIERTSRLLDQELHPKEKKSGTKKPGRKQRVH